MIQDVWPYRIDKCYAATEPDAESYLIFLKQDCLLLKCGRHLMSLPQYGDIPAQGLELTYLFSAGNHTKAGQNSTAIASSYKKNPRSSLKLGGLILPHTFFDRRSKTSLSLGGNEATTY